MLLGTLVTTLPWASDQVFWGLWWEYETFNLDTRKCVLQVLQSPWTWPPLRSTSGVAGGIFFPFCHAGPVPGLASASVSLLSQGLMFCLLGKVPDVLSTSCWAPPQVGAVDMGT